MNFFEIQEKEKDILFNTYSRYPLAIIKGKGTKLYDIKGNEYTDLLAGISVCNLGHCHPEISKIIKEEAQRLIHVSNLFYTIPQIELGKKLLSYAHFDKIFFCNSGAEANEAAIKLARRYMQKIRGENRYEIITLTGSFHGRTLATLTATGQDKIKQGFYPLPAGFKSVSINNIKEIENSISDKTAAIMIEIIQGEGGIVPLKKEYIEIINKLCEKHNILLIVDEVQTGMGRTGKMWAFMHYSIKPHIITCAKALANGLPMGAMMAKKEIAQGLEAGSHATTFGGGPLISKVALKVLEIIEQQNLIKRAEEIGKYTLDMLEELKKQFPNHIKEIRGKGLMIGIELQDNIDANFVFHEILKRKYIVNLTHQNTIRLLPPLIISKEEILIFKNILKEIFKNYTL